MSTDYQQARMSLGVLLKELRLSRPDGRLTGSQLAEELGWQQSKVSKLENGRQTATPEDLRQWTDATGHPGKLEELMNRLAGFESHTRSWRRHLAAGHRPAQEAINEQHAKAAGFRIWEPAAIPGILQTPDYARAIFTRYAELRQVKKDVEEAVRARMKRQENLYDARKKYRIVVWEAALYSLICPPTVLAAQLDRLIGAIGLDTVELGIVPLTASLKIPPGNSFWIYDELLVVVEDWHAELWLDDSDSVATYARVWDTIRDSAVYGADAHKVLARASHAIGTR